jgi:hypothetical protein
MDSERFDTITRTLASGMSRRGVLRTLSAVGAGGVLAVVGRGTVAAKGRPCKSGTPCGSGKSFDCCTDKENCIGDVCHTPACRTDPAYGGNCQCWKAGSPATGGNPCGLGSCTSAVGAGGDVICSAEDAYCTC